MGIFSKPMPQSAQDVLGSVKSWDDRRLSDPRANRLSMKKVGDQQLLPSHPLFYFGLLALVGGSPLRSATAIGWRQIVIQGDTLSTVVVECVSDRKFRFGHKHELPNEISELSNLPAIEKLLPTSDRHELRALTVPPLVDSALWLIQVRTRKNWILPIRTCAIFVLAASTLARTLSRFSDLWAVTSLSLYQKRSRLPN